MDNLSFFFGGRKVTPKALHYNHPQHGKLTIWPPPTENVPPPPVTPPPVGNASARLLVTDSEKTQLRIRVGLEQGGGTPMYVTANDVSPGSPGDWNRIITGANAAKNDPNITAWTSIWTGNPPWPRGGENPAAHNSEPRPENNAEQSVVYAAYVYKLLGDTSYAEPCRVRLLALANHPSLDWDNTTMFPRAGATSWTDVNPGFIVMEFMTKMLYAYDMIEPVLSLVDRDTIRTWFIKCANFARTVVNTDLQNLWNTGRLNNVYSLNRTYSLAGHLWQDGPPVYSTSAWYNNRRMAWAKFFFLAGVKFNLQPQIDDGIRFFKECLAFSVYGDGSLAELYRGHHTDNKEQVGYGYCVTNVMNLIQMADGYARFGNNMLYEYALTSADTTMFYANHTNEAWYPYVSENAVGRNLFQVIDAFMGFTDGRYGSTRFWGDQIIRGYNDTNTNYTGDTVVAQANVYYKNNNWMLNYTRQLPASRAYNRMNRTTGYGSFGPWEGPAATLPGLLLTFGQMENKVNPYSGGSQGFYLHTSERTEILKRIPNAQGKYIVANDVSPGSPGDWNRVLNGANAARINPAVNAWTSIYTGPDPWPKGTEAEHMGTEPRPENNSEQATLYAAFVFRLTDDVSYATPVRDRLLALATNPHIDFSNRSRFPVSGGARWGDVNPGFFVLEFMAKMLYAYDLVEETLDNTEKTIILKWFLDCAEYARLMVNGELDSLWGSNRRNNNYKLQRAYTIPGHMHQGGPAIHSTLTWYNNRRIAWAKYFFLCGCKFNIQIYKDDGIRFFKEYIAYGVIADGSLAEFYRGQPSRPQTGYAYATICMMNLIQMADAYARFVDSSLYDYVQSPADSHIFYHQNTNEAWYNTINAPNKSFQNVIEMFMAYTDGRFGNTRQWNNENIRGQGATQNVNYTGDTIVAMANLYFKNDAWKANYMRALSASRPYNFLNRTTGTGSWAPWDGPLAQFPGVLLCFGQMEGLVNPYFDPNTQPANFEFSTVGLNQNPTIGSGFQFTTTNL